MTEPASPHGIDTRDKPEHWDMLANRVATAAALRSRQGTFEWLARSRAAWAATFVLLAVAVILMQTASETSDHTSLREQWAEMVTPSDNVGQAITRRDGPPAVAALLLSGQGARTR
jgi:hypothetical protein